MAALLALVSSVLWGAADFLGGAAARRRATWQVVVWSQTIAAVVLGVIVVSTAAWRDIHPGSWMLWALLAGAAGFAGLLCFYAALAQGTMGVVSPIAAMGVLVPLTVGLASGERLSHAHAVGVGAAIVGIVLASGPELSARSPWRPVLLAALAALSFGVAIVGVARGSQVSVLMTMLVMRAFAVLLFVAVIFTVPTMRTLARREVAPLLIIGVLDIAANITYGFATRLEALAIVSVLGSIYPIVTVALARLVLKERLAKIQYLGVAVAMCGVAFISL